MITLAPIATAGNAFHVDLGDLPTWFGVIAASIAAYFVYGQLRSQEQQLRGQERQLRSQEQQLRIQQQEFVRQVRVIERQQADQIDVRPNVFVITDEEVLQEIEGWRGEGTFPPRPRVAYHNYWSAIYVENRSGRPIRKVSARWRRRPAPFEEHLPTTWAQPIAVGWTTFEAGWNKDAQSCVARAIGPHDVASLGDIGARASSEAKLVRTSTVHVLVFVQEDRLVDDGGYVIRGFGQDEGLMQEPKIRVRFTDDAGLDWQIDDDMHLDRLETRDW